jgi:6-phosphogluconolactonase (cycloisomerase 2 family)
VFLYALQDVNAGANQLHGFSVDATTGALTPLAGFPMATGDNGNGFTRSEQMAYDSANRRLYVANGSTSVSVFSVNGTTGALTALPFSPIVHGVAGGGSCVAVHPSGSPLVVGSGGSSLIASFNITATIATPAAGSPFTTGAASPFSCAFSRDGSFVYTGGNIGTSFAGFSVNAATGVLTALAGSPFDSAANNPQGYVTDSAGRLFLTNSGTAQVRAFTTTAGVPAGVAGNPFTSGVSGGWHGVLHAAGFYMVADRGGNRVGVFQIAGSGAATTLAAVTGSPFAAGGTFTDVLALNPAGTFLYAANGNSRNITVFAVNSATGALSNPVTQPADTLGTTGRITGMARTP